MFNILKATEICYKVFDGTHDSPKYIENGYPLVTSKYISNNKIDTISPSKISKKDYDKINTRSKVMTNDILISMIGTVGLVARIKDDPCFAIKNIGVLRPKSELDSKYIFYYLQSNYAQELITSQLNGSTQQYLSLEKLRNLDILYPKNENYKRHIVNIIGSIDDLIEQYNSSINKLWDLITLKYSKSFPNIHNLKGLNVKSLNDVCDRFATGLNPRNNFKLGYGTNYYVTIKNFETGNLFLNDKCDKVDDDALLKINNRSDLQKGDILFSGIGTIGRTYLIPETPVNWNISESVFSIRPSKEISSEFLYLLLTDQDMQSYSHDNASGSVQKGIRMADIKAYKFNSPSKEEIFEFTNNVLNLFIKIENFKKQISYLTNLKENYLKKFFG